MFCILLANLRKRVKTPYNLRQVNCGFSGIASLENLLIIQFLPKKQVAKLLATCFFVIQNSKISVIKPLP